MTGVVITPHGVLDEEAASTFRRELTEDSSVDRVVIDLTDTLDLDHAGVQFLHGLDQHLNGSVVLVSPSDRVRGLLTIHGLNHLLELRASTPSATKIVRVPPARDGVVELAERRRKSG